MDPHVVFDCHKVLPDKFVLTLAAAARARALRHGAEPRLEMDSASVGDLALNEIATGVFSEDELSTILREPASDGRCRHPARAPNFAAAALLVPLPRPPPKKARRFIDMTRQTELQKGETKPC